MFLSPQGAPKSFKISFYSEKGHSAEDRVIRMVKINNIKGNILHKNLYSCHLRLLKVFFSIFLFNNDIQTVIDCTHMINSIALYLNISIFSISFTTDV